MAEPEEATEAEDAAADDRDTSDDEATPDEAPRLVFLDPELSEQTRESLEDALGCPIHVLPPDDLDRHFPRAIDRGIVVPYQLPSQSGLDLVETLRLRDDGRDLPIAVVDDQPTRSKVFAALRVGATSFARRPYDAEELKLRLGDALACIADAATDDAAQEPSGEEEASADVSE